MLVLVFALGAGAAWADDPLPRWPLDSEGGVRVAADGRARFIYLPEFRPAVWLKQQLSLHGLKDLQADLVAPVLAVAAPRGSKTVLPAAASRLLIQGAPAQVAAARELLARLDLAARSVFVSLLVSEVSRSHRTSTGASLLFDKGAGTNPENTVFRTAALGFVPDDYIRSSVTGAMPFEGTTLTFGDMDASGGAFEYTLRMLQRQGEAEFLAWPSMLCSENEPGFMQATELLPHLQTTLLNRRAAGVTTARTESSVIAQTGLKLRITPVRIGVEYAVLDIDVWMTLPQYVTDGTTTPNALRLRTREVTTRVTVRDREPLCLGGIILRDNARSRRGLPRPKSLNVLDPLHSARLRTCSETEVVFLLRARVVKPRSRPLELDPKHYRRWTEVGPRAGANALPGPWKDAKHPAREKPKPATRRPANTAGAAPKR